MGDSVVQACSPDYVGSVIAGTERPYGVPMLENMRIYSIAARGLPIFFTPSSIKFERSKFSFTHIRRHDVELSLRERNSSASP